MLDSRVHDFLGQELNVKDVIVYPVSSAGRPDMVKAEILELLPYEGADSRRRGKPYARVKRLAHSSGGFGSPAVPATGATSFFNLGRCVRVEKHSPTVVDLAGDHHPPARALRRGYNLIGGVSENFHPEDY